MENQLKNRRVTFRLTDHQWAICEFLQTDIFPDHNKSQILRTILETLYAKAKSAGY